MPVDEDKDVRDGHLMIRSSVVESGEMRVAGKVFACLSLLVLTVLSTILTEASKQADGSYAYNTFTIPCTVELVKFAFSYVALHLERKTKKRRNVRVSALSMSIKYAVPAFCYFVSNNCSFFIIRHLGPTTFQITNSLKILSTGILMQIVLGRRLSWQRWKSLILLVIGTLISRSTPNATFSDVPYSNTSPPYAGYAFIILNATAAGLGGVVSEKLLKTNDLNLEDSLHWKNSQLYFFGMLFGVCKLTFLPSSQIQPHVNFFDGFNIYAYAIIFAHAAGGLAVSFILKYMDNITNCFVSGLSMLCVALVHANMQDESVSIDVFLGILLIFLATEQYHGVNQ